MAWIHTFNENNIMQTIFAVRLEFFLKFMENEAYLFNLVLINVAILFLSSGRFYWTERLKLISRQTKLSSCIWNRLVLHTHKKS